MGLRRGTGRGEGRGVGQTVVQTGVQPQGINHCPLDPGSYCHPGPTLQGHHGGQATDSRSKCVSEGAETGGGEEPPAPQPLFPGWAGGVPHVLQAFGTGVRGELGGSGGAHRTAGPKSPHRGRGSRHKSSREELVDSSINSGKVEPSAVKLKFRAVGWWCARLQRGAFAPWRGRGGLARETRPSQLLRMIPKAFEAARREAAVGQKEPRGIAPRSSRASLGAAAPWGTRRGARLLTAGPPGWEQI